MRFGTRRALSLALAATLVLSGTPVGALADESDATLDDPQVTLTEEVAGEEAAPADEAQADATDEGADVDEGQPADEDKAAPADEGQQEEGADQAATTEEQPADAADPADEQEPAAKEEAEALVEVEEETTDLEAIVGSSFKTGKQTAKNIPLGSSVSGTYGRFGKTDWYKVTLPSAGRLRLNYTNSVHPSLFLQVFDAKGQSIGDSKSPDLESCSMSCGYDLTKGTYYISLFHWDLPGSYTLTAKFTSCNESFSEKQGGSNNTMATASAIDLGKSYKGQLALNDSEDFYTFTLPSAGRITITCKARINPYFYLYDASGRQLWLGQGEMNEEGVLDYTQKLDLTKGTYYLAATKTSPDDTSGFTVKVGFTSCNESFSEEQGGSDYSMETANAIALNKSYKGQIALNDSEDFYTFTLPSAGRITLIFKARIPVSLYVYDASGEQLWDERALTDDEGVLDYAQTLDLTKGTYYLQVTKEAWWYETSGYAFKVGFASCNESFSEEQGGSNNTMATASAIALNKSYKGQMALNDLRDFYRFKLSSAGRITLTFKGEIHPEICIYNASGKVVWSDFAYPNEEGLLDYADIPNLPKGTYYLSVTGGSISGDGNYTIKVSVS